MHFFAAAKKFVQLNTLGSHFVWEYELYAKR